MTRMMMMKYVLSLVTALVFSGTAIWAQQGFRFAPMAGFNMSQIDGDDWAGYKKIGAVGGLRVAYQLAPRWRMAMEMQFLQTGSRRGKNEGGGLEKINLNMVEVPLLVQFIEWKFQVTAGVSYGRIIGYSVIDLAGEDVSDQAAFQYRPDQFFVQGGVTFMFTDRFGGDVRLSRAFTNLAPEGQRWQVIRNITVKALYEFGL